MKGMKSVVYVVVVVVGGLGPLLCRCCRSPSRRIVVVLRVALRKDSGAGSLSVCRGCQLKVSEPACRKRNETLATVQSVT